MIIVLVLKFLFSFGSSPPVPLLVGGTYTVTAVASSGLSLTYASVGVPANCSVAGNVVTISAVGTCSITASHPANANYNAGTATQTFG